MDVARVVVVHVWVPRWVQLGVEFRFVGRVVLRDFVEVFFDPQRDPAVTSNAAGELVFAVLCCCCQGREQIEVEGLAWGLVEVVGVSSLPKMG